MSKSIDMRKLKNIIALPKESGVEEFEADGMRLRFRKPEPQQCSPGYSEPTENEDTIPLPRGIEMWSSQ